MSNVSIIPVAFTPEDIIFYFFLLARFSGLFLLSPILSNQMFPVRVRVLFTVFTTLVIGTVLWADYRGPEREHLLQDLDPNKRISLVSVGTVTLIELTIGYVIGFAFALLYEALLLAGQMIGLMAGLSVTEMLDPVSNTPNGLIGQMLSILTTLLILTLDLHHIYIRATVESFSYLPIGSFSVGYEFLGTLEQGTARLFHHGLRIATIPFVILALITVALGFMARIMPEMNIFMVGFPLKIIVGLYSLFFTISYFPPLLRSIFSEYYNMSHALLRYIQ